jgi:hypothetical protein
MANRIDICPKCGGTEWTFIPDSLASHCKCGFVRVMDGEGGHEEGASIQQWLKDVYGRVDGNIIDINEKKENMAP